MRPLSFKPSEKIRLFFSYRYTPEHVRKILADYGLEVCEQWIAPSEEEGVFLCRAFENNEFLNWRLIGDSRNSSLRYMA
jgi:hypothetical protein